jgi:exosome complex component CSL4
MARSLVPALQYEVGSIVAPGDHIGSSSEVSVGSGAYVKSGQVYASVVGTVHYSLDHSSSNSKSVTVVLPQGRMLASGRVLVVGQVILAKVERCAIQQVTVGIVASFPAQSSEQSGFPTLLSDVQEGVVRREEVSASVTAEDLKMETCFRPGDVILAKIVSLGDGRRYLLSTAEAELGVVRATCSTSGSTMIPISWNEMQCPDTEAREPRKCAKPRDLPTAKII